MCWATLFFLVYISHFILYLFLACTCWLLASGGITREIFIVKIPPPIRIQDRLLIPAKWKGFNPTPTSLRYFNRHFPWQCSFPRLHVDGNLYRSMMMMMMMMMMIVPEDSACRPISRFVSVSRREVYPLTLPLQCLSRICKGATWPILQHPAPIENVPRQTHASMGTIHLDIYDASVLGSIHCGPAWCSGRLVRVSHHVASTTRN